MWTRIEGQPVFLPKHQWRELLLQVTADWEQQDRDAACDYLSPSRRLLDKADQLAKEYVLTLSKTNPTEFEEKYRRLAYTGDEARSVLHELLADYCEVHGHASVQTLAANIHQRAWQDQSLSGVLNRMDAYPVIETIGAKRILVVSHTVRPRRWWWRFKPFSMSDRVIRVYVHLNEVVLVQGVLEDFMVVGRKQVIRFAENIDICPLTSIVDGKVIMFTAEK